MVIAPTSKEDEGTYLIEARLTDKNNKSSSTIFKITIAWNVPEEIKEEEPVDKVESKNETMPVVKEVSKK